MVIINGYCKGVRFMNNKSKRKVLLPNRINFRCNDKEVELVNQGAKRNNTTQSGYIRMLIREDSKNFIK